MRMIKTAPAAIHSGAVSPESTDDSTRNQWSAELVSNLDWHRLVEIARSLAASEGFELSKNKTDIAGGAEFVMSKGDALARHSTLVRLAQWQRWTATSECVESFIRQIQIQRLRGGIFIAPGGFQAPALELARNAGVETVDATLLAAKLNSLPAAQGNDFYNAGTTSRPSCPICLNPLVMGRNGPPSALDYLALPDVHYRTDDLVAEPILARCLEVQRGCEVRFLSQVQAQEIIISGIAEGAFICEGTLLLNPGAVLRGIVAARSVLVRPGAELDGETRILEGPLKVSADIENEWTWRCTNSASLEHCKAVRLLPHEPTL